MPLLELDSPYFKKSYLLYRTIHSSYADVRSMLLLPVAQINRLALNGAAAAALGALRAAVLVGELTPGRQRQPRPLLTRQPQQQLSPPPQHEPCASLTHCLAPEPWPAKYETHTCGKDIPVDNASLWKSCTAAFNN